MKKFPDQTETIEPLMTRTHFPPLDGFRGVAILLVLFIHSFHYSGPSLLGRSLNTLAQAGWTGVTAFYVLSGFLITGILLDTRPRPHYLRDFYARRSLRIFPLYFAFLVAYFFVIRLPPLAMVGAQLALPEAGTSYPYWTYLTNMREFLTGHTAEIAALNPLWSLAVEEQVYLFWPFLIRAIPPRRLTIVLIGLAVGSLSWRFGTRWTRQSIEVTHAWMPAALEAFAAGGLVAHLARSNPVLVRRWSARIVAAAGGLLIGLGIWLGHFNYWYSPVEILTLGVSLTSTCCAALIGWSVSAAASVPLNRVLAAGWLRSLGRYSYSLYLLHTAIILLLLPVVYCPRTGLIYSQVPAIDLGFFLLVVLVSYGVAWLTWHCWEEPFLRLKRYFPLSGGVPRPDGESVALVGPTAHGSDR